MGRSGQELTYIGIGANLGRRLETMRKAVGLIERFMEVVGRSPVYESEALGYSDPSPYLNAVVAVNTRLSGKEILTNLLEIEQALGRQRLAQRNGEKQLAGRTIDLDILFVGNVSMESPFLTVPHPLIEKRMFVLQPLCDLMPDFVHPKSRRTIKELTAACEGQSLALKYTGL